MSDRKEKLNEILSRFYEDDQAGRMEQEIVRGEQLLTDNPAPEPDKELIAEIKAQVSNRLSSQRSYQTGRYIRAALAAAAVIAIAVGLLFVHNHRPTEKPVVIAETESIWESDDLTEDDAELAILVEDVEALAEEVIALRLDENGAESMSTDELEIEFLEISNDFWKG